MSVRALHEINLTQGFAFFELGLPVRSACSRQIHPLKRASVAPSRDSDFCALQLRGPVVTYFTRVPPYVAASDNLHIVPVLMPANNYGESCQLCD